MVELNAEMILAATDIKSKVEAVEVPEWGGTVYLRIMTAGERDAHEIEWMVAKEKGGGVSDFRTKMLVRCLCDAEGKRLFSDAQIEGLKQKSGEVVDRLWKKSMVVNGLTDAAVVKAAGE